MRNIKIQFDGNVVENPSYEEFKEIISQEGHDAVEISFGNGWMWLVEAVAPWASDWVEEESKFVEGWYESQYLSCLEWYDEVICSHDEPEEMG